VSPPPRSIAVRRPAFADSGDRADLYIRTSLKRSPSGLMSRRLPMLIMRVEKVPFLRHNPANPCFYICIYTFMNIHGASVGAYRRRTVYVADTPTGSAQDPQKEIPAEGDEHRRQHRARCCAFNRMSCVPCPRCVVSHAYAVYEKVGDAQPKYSINLERCDLVKVSICVQAS
jgi:hypothetical protein